MDPYQQQQQQQAPLMAGQVPNQYGANPYQQQGQYPPQQQQGQYPPQQQQGQYPPQQQQGQYPPQQQQGQYPPQQQGQYPPQQQQGQYPPQQQQQYPPQQAGYGGPAAPPVMGVQDCLNAVHTSLAAQKLVIKQKVSLLEAAGDTMGCDCCCEQPNQYDVYDAYTGQHVMQANEESEFCWRCCCNPSHPLKLRLRIPQTQQIVATVDRPFKCSSGCPAWCGFCQQEASLYAGTDVENTAARIGKTEQPCCGGLFTPTVKVATGQNEPSENHFAVAEGPMCFFGGMTELCCDQEFFVSSNGDKQGDIAKIVKEKPEGMQQMAQELMTDSDLFTMQFANSSLGPEQKLTLISSLLLMDYMFFESNQPFECDPIAQTCSVTCCNMYCCGAIQPCKCKCGGAQDDSNSN